MEHLQKDLWIGRTPAKKGFKYALHASGEGGADLRRLIKVDVAEELIAKGVRVEDVEPKERKPRKKTVARIYGMSDVSTLALDCEDIAKIAAMKVEDKAYGKCMEQKQLALAWLARTGEDVPLSRQSPMRPFKVNCTKRNPAPIDDECEAGYHIDEMAPGLNCCYKDAPPKKPRAKKPRAKKRTAK